MESLLVFVLVGVILLLGIGLDCIWMQLDKKPIGTLCVDRSDPDTEPYLFLELEPGGMQQIQKNKTVTLKVNLDGYLPRK